ncbi:membrane protein [Gallibacterium genomosp. 3]|uniref:Membrane protein n=2 Tax=Gallibacterium genomosp. 3 TaxID=505345 RepID=A0A1A7NQM9_9PAST|nr:outer membrane protein transport protein [Gallibacterium genomosp. 3]OBW91915.1 membrane protein [Gallibacterium genomosp. 3]
MRLLSKTLLASLVAVASQGAFASAFQLHETSTSGLGRAYAGDAAVADDASVVASNPALMTFFKRPEISVGGIYVNPNIDLTGTFGSVDAGHKNIATKELVPYFYTVYPVNDRFSVGGGVNVNYGLATEFDNGYNAGPFGGKTDLTTLNFNLSGAYRVTNNFSIGAGLNAVYADAVVERHLGMLGAGAAQKLALLAHSNPAAAAQYTALASKALSLDKSTLLHKLEGDAWGYGWNIGAVYEFNENNRIGVSYHSHVDIDFDGDYTTEIPAQLWSVLNIKGGNGDGSLTLPLPAYWEVAGYHRVLPKFAVTYSVKRTEWSRFQELYAHRGGQELFQKDEKFSDTTRIALGFIYDVDDKLTLRAGVAHDESAVSKGHYSISIPDTDRTWYTLGATYRFTPNLSVDAGFAFIKGKHLNFTESQNGVSGTFDSKSTATLYGLGLNYRF